MSTSTNEVTQTTAKPPGEKAQPGIAGFEFSKRDMEVPAVKRLVDALREELALLRAKNDAEQGIADTTILRGQIKLAKKILVRADEAGQEATQDGSE